MIASLDGTIQLKTNKSLIVEVNKVGYEVFVTSLFMEKVKAGDPVNLFTHMYVREDIMELYGFPAREELDLFKLLIGVSGVGPKSGLTIMSLVPVGDMKNAITSEDDSLLTKVSGIGSKTAQRIIIELKNKITFDAKSDGQGLSGVIADGEAIDALVSLGYTIREAREALSQVDHSIETAAARVREALKMLGKR
ncbi:Holliday junction branch migration protein RuvA [Patescibacteria group bacterium]|nr:Holliday junction branch migration protein RuvA [Patescibacteria group bacterium]